MLSAQDRLEKVKVDQVIPWRRRTLLSMRDVAQADSFAGIT
jgi:hypothetical protein